MKTNPNEPAVGYPDNMSSIWIGLTKREIIAKDCLAALIGITEQTQLDIRDEVATAIEYADELIRQLNQSPAPAPADVVCGDMLQPRNYDTSDIRHIDDVDDDRPRYSDLDIEARTRYKLRECLNIKSTDNPYLYDLINRGLTQRRFKRISGVGPIMTVELKYAFEKLGVEIPEK